MNSKAPIRVLIVDDSALIRQLLSKILSDDPGIEVVATANDPYIAREKIKLLEPDVITLDVEMPRMDGITFLQNLMRLHPIPTIMVSSLTTKGADVTMRALELGVIDFVTKPDGDVTRLLEAFSEEIIAKVKVAASVSKEALLRKAEQVRRVPRAANNSATLAASATHFKTTDKLIAIGASTGGTEAIKEVLMQLPHDSPGVVISQHIPPLFSTSFAARMNDVSALAVCEAQDGQQILNGHAYIAPGGQHLKVERNGTRFICKLDDSPPVNRHKPSVDVMFGSIADNVGINAVGVILTGMGHDGAQGLKKMHDLGVATIAQDEKTSIVWGMPGSAVKLDAIDTILPLDKIAGKIITLVK